MSANQQNVAQTFCALPPQRRFYIRCSVMDTFRILCKLKTYPHFHAARAEFPVFTARACEILAKPPERLKQGAGKRNIASAKVFESESIARLQTRGKPFV